MNQDLKPWVCQCGNILGLMHKNGDSVTVLNLFFEPVRAGQLKKIAAQDPRKIYIARDLFRSEIICRGCGRSSLWDANEIIIKNRMRDLGLEEQYKAAKRGRGKKLMYNAD